MKFIGNKLKNGLQTDARIINGCEMSLKREVGNIYRSKVGIGDWGLL